MNYQRWNRLFRCVVQPVGGGERVSVPARHLVGKPYMRWIVGLITLLLLSGGIQPAHATSLTNTYVFAPTADAYVSEAKPDRNYGHVDALRVDGVPDYISFLRFEVYGLSGSVVEAHLWLYGRNDARSELQVHHVLDGAWQELEITYNNAPPIGEVVSEAHTVHKDEWLIVDVSALVVGEGLWNLALTTPDDTGLRFDSREEEEYWPRLVIKTQEEAPVLRMLTFAPEADAYVFSERPDRNFGHSQSLRTDASPVMNSYLRFDVTDIDGEVVKAELKVFARTRSDMGYEVHQAASKPWQEDQITFNNAPAVEAWIGASGAFEKNSWTTVDVTPLIRENGTVTLVLTSQDETATRFSSRESMLYQPRLEIQVVDAGMTVE